MRSTKEIGAMIDDLEDSTEEVKRKLQKPKTIEEGYVIGLLFAIVIWIIVTVTVLFALGVI